MMVYFKSKELDIQSKKSLNGTAAHGNCRIVELLRVLGIGAWSANQA